jgi:hypothetical protein
MSIHCFGRILLNKCPVDPIFFHWLHSFVKIISILLVSVFHHFILEVLFGVLNVGHRLVSCERISLGSRSPSQVTSSVLQLVSERVRSLVVLNWLCDLKAIWRKVSSSLWFSMVKILVIGRTEQGTTC